MRSLSSPPVSAVIVSAAGKFIFVFVSPELLSEVAVIIPVAFI